MFYSIEFKLKVVKEFLKGDVSKAFLRRKYNILGHSTIQKWILKYHKDKFNTVTFNNQLKNKKIKNQNNFTIGNVIMSQQQINLLEQMTNKVKELEKQLDQLQKERDIYKYESLILNKLVDVAEKNYNIQIKKNT